VLQDKAKAAGLYRKACDGGVAHGCFSLAVKYERGEGVLVSGAASADTYHQAGLLYLQQNDRSNALLCVERIRKLTDIQKLTVPNGFLADRLLDAIYGKGEAGSGKARAQPPRSTN
jgi:TPR repeat protein